MHTVSRSWSIRIVRVVASTNYAAKEVDVEGKRAIVIFPYPGQGQSVIKRVMKTSRSGSKSYCIFTS